MKQFLMSVLGFGAESRPTRRVSGKSVRRCARPGLEVLEGRNLCSGGLGSYVVSSGTSSVMPAVQFSAVPASLVKYHTEIPDRPTNTWQW